MKGIWISHNLITLFVNIFFIPNYLNINNLYLRLIFVKETLIKMKKFLWFQKDDTYPMMVHLYPRNHWYIFHLDASLSRDIHKVVVYCKSSAHLDVHWNSDFLGNKDHIDKRYFTLLLRILLTRNHHPLNCDIYYTIIIISRAI